jgi:hypothetical protein
MITPVSEANPWLPNSSADSNIKYIKHVFIVIRAACSDETGSA